MHLFLHYDRQRRVDLDVLCAVAHQQLGDEAIVLWTMDWHL